MIDLNLLQYQKTLNFKNENGTRFIFGQIRKKYLVLTPEELVRQLTIHYLIYEKNYGKNHIAVEKSIYVNKMLRRFDIMVYNPDFSPKLLIECKAPQIPLKQSVFEQVARYNLSLKVPYLLVTNGLSSYCCLINHQEQTFEFLKEVPSCKSNLY